MNEYITHNKISFLMQKEKTTSFQFWIVLFFFIMLWSSCLIKVNLSYKTFAIYKKASNNLEIYWQYNELEKLNDIEKIKINNIEIDFQIQNMSEIKIDQSSLQNYQILEVMSPKEFIDNQILQIQLLDKKEKVIEKVKKIIMQGG